MDELVNGQQEQFQELPPEPGKNEIGGQTGKKKSTGKIVKRTFVGAGLALAVYFVYSMFCVFILPDRNIQQIYPCPKMRHSSFNRPLRLMIGESSAGAPRGNA